MIIWWLKPALLLTAICALPILVIRAQPYDDRVTSVLVGEKCAPPCFMGILPGWTTMREAFYIVAGHDWVANSADQFPSLIRGSAYFDAGVPRTVVHWRWSATLPAWIDGAQRGSMTVENIDVLALTLDTHLSPGEIMLAFGDPDEAQFRVVDNLPGQRFEYIAWYASQKMLVRAEGVCPIRHYYGLSARIAFRLDSPRLSDESIPKTAVCR